MGFPDELKAQLLAPFTKKPAEPATQTATPAQQGFPQDLAQSLLAPFQSNRSTASGGGSGGFSGGAPSGALGPIDSSSPDAFYKTAYAYAKQAEKITGVPAELSLAISANETGHGQTRYMAGANNYHGIQAQPGEPGAVPYKDWRPDGSGGQQFYDAAQRSFADPLAGFVGFGQFLTQNPRYAGALERYKQTGDKEELARGIHAAGYAEDPDYAKKITSIMRGIPTQGVGDVNVTPSQPISQQSRDSAWAGGDLTPDQFNSGLSSEDALAACGPAAAIAFARKNGRNPTMGEALELAKKVGWNSDQGMAGPESQIKLLRNMGVAAKLEGLDKNKIAADVQRGNPVIINASGNGGHYYVAERYDPTTGKFDFGNSAKILSKSGGNTWYTLDELAALGVGSPTAAIYMDSPESPSPSVVAGSSRSMLADNAPDTTSRPESRSFKGMTYSETQNDPTLQSQQQIDTSSSDWGSDMPFVPNPVNGSTDASQDSNPPVDAIPSSEPAPSQPEAPLNPMQQFANTLASAAQALQESFKQPPVEPQRPARPENFNLPAAESRAQNAASTAGLESTLPAMEAANAGFAQARQAPIDFANTISEQTDTETQRGNELTRKWIDGTATPDEMDELGKIIQTEGANVAGNGIEIKGAPAARTAGRTVPEMASGIVSGADNAQPMDRYYHGTGGDFARPDPGKFDPNGLFGPGYYITDEPIVASDYARQRSKVYDPDTLPQELRKIANEISDPVGPTVRPLDVPRDLNLFDMDPVATVDDIRKIRDSLPPDIQSKFDSYLSNHSGDDGKGIYDALLRVAPHGEDGMVDRAAVNKLLSDAGYDGVRYEGGNRMPMFDAQGKEIKHRAAVIFSESLDKIRNATAGTPGGLSAATGDPSNLAIGKKIGKDAVQGGVAATYAQNRENPESTPQDYLTAAMKGAAGGVLRGHLRDRYTPGQGSAIVNRAAADASKDFDTIRAEREQVARGVERPSHYTPDVDDFFSLKGRLKRYFENPTAMSDRREAMNTLEQHRAAKGEPMSFAERIYTRLRLYDGQGNADAALQSLDTNVRPAFEAFAKDGGDELDLSTLFEQLDNVYKDAAAARSFGVPPPATGTNASPMRPARQFSGGATVQAEQDIWDHIEQRFGPKRAQLMHDAADAASAHMDGLRQELLDAGVISQEARDFWRDNFRHYFPAKILAYEADDKAIEQMGSRGALLGTREDGYRRLTEAGTEKMREDPIVSMIDATVAIHKLAERNKMMRDFSTFADTPYSSQFVEHLNDTSKLKDGYTSIAYRDGDTVKHVQVVDPLVPALTLAQPGQNIALRVIAIPGSIFKQGVTSLRPSFMAVNGLYDAFSTTMRQMIEAPDPIEAARAFTDLARGYRAAIGGTATGRSLSAAAGAVAGNQTTDPDEPILSPNRAARIAAGAAAGFVAGKGIQKKWGAEDRALIERYRRSGASIYTGTRWDDRPDMIAKELSGKHVWVRTIRSEADLKTAMKDTWGATRDVLGLAWSRPLEAVGAPIEMAPRLGEFARAERQGASQAEAALRSRRISTDFPGGGSTMKVVNMLVPFMNPAVQGSLEFAQLVRKRPAQSVAGFGVVAAAAFAAMAHNRAISEDDYADVSRTIGNTGIFLLDPNDPPEGQKRGVYYLPMRGGMAAVVPLIKKFYDDAYASGAALDWAGVTRQMGSTLTPFPGDATGATGALLPPSLKTVAELASNYNIYTGQAIVPKSLEGLPPSEQYNERTTATARALGSLTNKPPIAWDYGLGNVSKGPYEAATGVADIAFDVTGKTPDSRYADRGKEKTAADQPITGSIAGRVIRSVGSERQNRLYEQADAMIARNEANTVQAVKDSAEYQSATPDRQAQMMRQAQNVLAEQARAILDLDPKAKDLGQPSRWSGVTPGSDRERSIISAIGTPSDKRTPRQQALADQYRGRETETYRRWSERKQITDEKLKSAVKSSVEP